MRLTFLALVGCLACDSGAAKVAAPSAPSTPAAAPPPTASPTTSPPSAPPSPAPAANPTPAVAPLNPAPTPAPVAKPEAAAADARSEGPAECRFQRPAAWAGGQVTWLGSCQKGFAEGSGVLVNTLEGAEPDRFYGRLAAGSPSLGVLQSEGGYMAGRWANGALAPDLPDGIAQRNVVIDAFNAGAAAATAASKSLAKKDAAASSFYAKQARALREQMD
jgi:hypothetical protein